MRSETIEIYTFEELSEKAQEVALAANRNFNLEHDWWEFNYESFQTLCNLVGFEIDTKAVETMGGGERKTPCIYFNGFHTQGSYSAFECSIGNSEVRAIIESFNEKKWESEFPTISLSFPSLPKNWKRGLALMKADWIDFSINTKCSHRGGFSVNDEFRVYENKNNHPIVDEICNGLCEWVSQVLKELNKYLYKSLERESDYLYSDEAVKDSLIANEIEFLKNGSCPRY